MGGGLRVRPSEESLFSALPQRPHFTPHPLESAAVVMSALRMASGLRSTTFASLALSVAVCMVCWAWHVVFSA